MVKIEITETETENNEQSINKNADGVPTLCLNMIVKNESRIITRMLDSVVPIIDAYCICDTGSTDNTVELIRSYFEDKGIPGKVVIEPFTDFAYNRNFALQSCAGLSDFVLLMDADMTLSIRDFDKTKLKDYDSFYILQGSESFFYQNTRILRNNGKYKYVGVTHEYISTPSDNRLHSIKKDELFINDLGDGGCKSDKYERDIRLLSGAIEKEPNSDRYHFYLANSYHDAGQFEKAIPIYEKRIEIGGWVQEVWYSYYRIGLCYKKLGNIEKAINAWMEGYNHYPVRVENIYEIVNHYRYAGKQKIADVFYQAGKKAIQQHPNRNDHLFLHNDIYTFKLDFEYTIIAAYLGVSNICDETVNILNHCGDSQMNDNLLRNMKFYKQVLKPRHLLTFDDTAEKFVNGKLLKLQSSSSCIIPKKNNDGYIINIRYVNYWINSEGGYLNCDKNIVTFNRYAELTNDYVAVSDKWFNTSETTRRYVGIEDVRIFNDEATDELLFIGTGYHQNDQIGIVAGNYDITKDELEFKEVKPSFSNHGCEKNWVYVTYKGETHVIYNWAPLQICKMNEDKTVLNMVEERQMPKIFEKARGSSCGCRYVKKYKTGQPDEVELWFVVHVVSYESPRHYYHMLVAFDESLNLKRYSAPFKFFTEPIEYCLGIIVKDDTVLMNYSVWDRTTVVGIYDKKYIDSAMKYTA